MRDLNNSRFGFTFTGIFAIFVLSLLIGVPAGMSVGMSLFDAFKWATGFALLTCFIMMLIKNYKYR